MQNEMPLCFDESTGIDRSPPGAIWHVPPGAVHGGDILGDEPVIFVDVFHPIRQEAVEEMARNRARRLAEKTGG